MRKKAGRPKKKPPTLTSEYNRGFHAGYNKGMITATYYCGSTALTLYRLLHPTLREMIAGDIGL